MRHAKVVLTSALVLTGVALVAPRQPAHAQARPPARAPEPERQLLGVRLGRPAIEVIRRFGSPDEVQTVALAAPTDVLPPLGAGGGGMDGGMGMGMGPGGMAGMAGMPFGGPGGNSPAGMSGMAGMAGMGGMAGMPFGSPGGPAGGGMMMPGGAAFGGGSPFGGGGNGPAGGIPILPPAGGGGNGPGGMMPGMMPGMPGGDMGGMGAMGGGQSLPEYSTAILLIYKRGSSGSRLEFLINEDGRVAQISVAAPAGVRYPGVNTSRGISLGSAFATVWDRYGNPERHRMLPGMRFYEAYYTKNYHSAFTFDMKNKMSVVRITIALAD